MPLRKAFLTGPPFILAVIISLSMLLASCGGGGGGGGGFLPGSGSSGSTYSISGAVSGDIKQGVKLTVSGTVNASVTTDANGNYSVSGLPNGSYTVTPSKAGYTFTQAIRAVTISGANCTGDDFTATATQYTISGTVSGAVQAGVTITITGTTGGGTAFGPTTMTTDAGGSYSVTNVPNGAYKIVPSKLGYLFTQTSTAVTVSAGNMSGINFTSSVDSTVKFKISGTVSGDIKQGVTITVTGSASGSASTDINGYYEVTGLINGSYTVSASKSGYTFSPDLSVTINSADSLGSNFTAAAIPYTISGTLSGDITVGVTITVSGTTDGGLAFTTSIATTGGSYSVPNIPNGTYTVIPSKPGYTFTQPSIAIAINSADSTGNNFTAAAIPYTISGTVSGAVQAGVLITVTGTTEGGAPFTTSIITTGGSYSFPNIPNGTYTVTPSKLGYLFSQTSASVPVSAADVGGINFTSSVDSTYTNFKITGTVSGAIKQGVTITVTGSASGSASTDINGYYEVTGLINGSYTVSASKPGYTFSPDLSVAINSADSLGSNFTAAAIPYTISGAVSGDIQQGVLITVTGTTEGGATITPATASTDVNGIYTVSGIPNGTYNVLPTKAGYTFSPPSAVATVSAADVSGDNFSATAVLYSVSGTVSGDITAGVTITVSGTTEGGATITPATATTGVNGSYTVSGIPNGNYTVTPSKAGYAFNPPPASVNINGTVSTGDDFTAAAIPYSISGTVGGVPAGVTVTLTISGTTEGGASYGPVSVPATTGAGGAYTVSLPNGTYTITLDPSSSYSGSVAVTVSSGALTSQNITTTVNPAVPGANETTGGCSNNDSPACAGPIAIGSSYVNTLSDADGVDWWTVTFPVPASDTTYEISVNNLSNAADTKITVYDSTLSPITDIDNNAYVDDYIGLDSRSRILIPATNPSPATYYIKVENVNWNTGPPNPYTGTSNGAAIYTINVHEYIDGGNGYSTYYSCGGTADPTARFCPGNFVPPTQDAADNTVATAQPMVAATGDGWELQYHPEIYANARTIYQIGHVDVFSIVIPAQSAVYVYVAASKMASNALFGTVTATELDSTGTPVTPTNSAALAGYLGYPTSPYPPLFIENTDVSAHIFYVQFEATIAGDTGYYVPFYFNIGKDIDGDMFYTQDWPGYRDCNDNDPNIYPGNGCP